MHFHCCISDSCFSQLCQEKTSLYTFLTLTATSIWLRYYVLLQTPNQHLALRVQHCPPTTKWSLPTKLLMSCHLPIPSQVTQHEHFDLELAPWPTPPLYPAGHDCQEFSKLKPRQPVLARQFVAALLVLPYIRLVPKGFQLFSKFQFQTYGANETCFNQLSFN